MQTPTTYHELFNMLSRKDASHSPFVRPNAEGKVTIDDANKLLKAFSQLEDLHFTASDNGCGLRTSLMENLLKAAGVKTSTLMIHYDDAAEWHHHFSPGVSLQGSTELHVIDPTTETNVVSLSAWAKSNGKTEKEIMRDDDIAGTMAPDKVLKTLKDFAQQQVLQVA